MRRRRSWRSALGDNRGTAAVEFALIFSLFLLPLFIGLIEVITLYRAQEKLNAFVNDLALMVSLEGTGGTTTGVYSVAATGANANSLQDVCNGAVAGFAPYPPNSLTVQIASVTMEAGPNGLPATNSSTSFVYHSGSSLYDQWEQDFTVAGGSCATQGVAGIGASTSPSNATNLTTSNPPSTAGGSGGLVIYPCDNGIIVKATMSYPGLLGLIITRSMTLSQSAYVRWRYASIVSELQCPTCFVSNNNTTALYGSVKQACNSSDTGATN
ncbi:MAG TPA: TadE/TadG family type IV pilus assembly protein [Acidocella sp.]|nr:TadE/TadG family type IV pilus assembly protein [Acidocella sp.]